MKLEDIKEQIIINPNNQKSMGIPTGHIHFGTISPYCKEPYASMRGVNSCRGYLHDDLRYIYFNDKINTIKEHEKFFAENPYRLLIAFKSITEIGLTTFLSNWEWFKSWQQYLGLREPIIKKAAYEDPTYDKNQYFYLELDPTWQRGILQNSFCTFILRSMIKHIFTDKVDFDKLYQDSIWRERDYLNKVGHKLFIFYLNNIHKMIEKEPFGKENDDFITHHDNYGFVNQSNNKKQLPEFNKFADSLVNFMAT